MSSVRCAEIVRNLHLLSWQFQVYNRSVHCLELLRKHWPQSLHVHKINEQLDQRQRTFHEHRSRGQRQRAIDNLVVTAIAVIAYMLNTASVATMITSSEITISDATGPCYFRAVNLEFRSRINETNCKLFRL